MNYKIFFEEFSVLFPKILRGEVDKNELYSFLESYQPALLEASQSDENYKNFLEDLFVYLMKEVSYYTIYQELESIIGSSLKTKIEFNDYSVFNVKEK